MNVQASTLVDLLRQRALQQPDRVAYTFLSEGQTSKNTLTYSELDREARAIGAYLQSLGAEGERVLLLYPPGLEYIAAFFGSLYAGAMAVPAYPPKHSRNLERLRSIVSDSRATFAFTTNQALSKLKPYLEHVPEFDLMRWETGESYSREIAEDWREPEISSDTLAFLQYTSGSTAQPKGVMVSHANLLHNEKVIQRMFRQTEGSVIVGWLPLYHDMGLIGTVLQTLYLGARCVLMSPASFLQRPVRWLQAISSYGATTSGGPNFAYDLCVRRISPQDRDALDLSAWSVAFNGAEPIRAETLDRFAEYFSPCGFRREAFHPCYGLAEATLAVAGKLTESPAIKRVASAAMENGRVVEVSPGDGEGRSLVGCGGGPSEQVIVIIDPVSGRQCAPDEVGEIWISGPSVAQGYWNRPAETQETFRARLIGEDKPFLRTGDLGFQRDGELFVTGRMKDLIIIRGRNLYPQDIEQTVEQSHPAFRPGGGAAFSVDLNGEEQLVVVHEIDPRKLPVTSEVIRIARDSVAEEYEAQLSAMVLLKPGSIPKTSSGKIQRHACRAKYLSGSLEVVAEWRAGASAEGSASSPVLPPHGLDRESIENWLRSEIAVKLDLDQSMIEVDRPLTNYPLDSLMAIELMHSLEATLGLTIQLSSLLEGLSITQLAGEVTRERPDRATDSMGEPDPVTKAAAEYPLSRGQQALWFLSQLSPDSSAYNIAVAATARPRLNVPALRRSIRRLVSRHASLRTNFYADRGAELQRVREETEFFFQEIDAANWEQAALEGRLNEEANYRFDLEKDSLLRVSLFNGMDGEQVILLVIHHIIADLWSLAVLASELGTIYGAEIKGSEVFLPPPSGQYADYVRWENEMLASEEGERLWEYWKNQLSGAPLALDLPADRPRPPVQTYRGDSHASSLDAELTRKLKELGQVSGTTMYMTLLTAFQILLSRYTGQEDLIVGSPSAGRSRAEFSGLIGYFVNPLLLRCDLSGDPNFVMLLAQARQTVLDAFRHRDYPFALLVERLQPERDPSRSPLCQVMFAWQKSHLLNDDGLALLAMGRAGGRMRHGELALESRPLSRRPTQFDLSLKVIENDGVLEANFEYNADLFDASTIERLDAHYRVLLEAMASNPQMRISELPLLTEAERRRQLIEWNETSAHYSSGNCLHGIFEQQVKRTPDAVAVTFEDESLSYAELDARANQLARYLSRLGSGPEAVVGLCLERGPMVVVAMLGVIKAGGAYLPLDPASPRERAGFMLADARAQVLLTQSSLSAFPSSSGVYLVYLDQEWGMIAGEDKTPLAVNVTPENLAYVIYTSGSTGQPKGVEISHAGIINLVYWHQAAFQVTEADRATQLAGIAFDACGWELWPYLAAGANVCLGPEEVRLSATALRDWVVAQGITLCFTPTPLAERALAEEWPTEIGLRCLLTGGDQLHSYPPASLPFRLVNNYGPTESSVVATSGVVDAGSPAVRLPTIGRPIANTQVYLLDRYLQPVPVGVIGELYVGGAGLARGYLARPELTAEKFVPCPFDRGEGARLYRTGDLSRFDACGKIEFLGRLDYQVKIRGYRIEIGEIEAILSTYPGVREAVVTVVNRGGVDGKEIAAYVLKDEARESSLTANQLSHHLHRYLPEYMLPQRYIFLDELPRSPNGKIDRRALPQPDESQSSPPEDYAAPRTAIEELLCGMWGEVLNLERVGINDNFFNLGGHSLLATRLISKLRQVFKVEVALRSLFESPTVAGLAERIETAIISDHALKLPPIRRAIRAGLTPLSFAQQRLWFLHQLEPQSAAYNVPGSAHLLGMLNIEALAKSFNQIIERHEILRTNFIIEDGQPAQLISPLQPVDLQLVDLQRLPAKTREMVAQRLMTAEARRPFELSQGPLLRTALFRLGALDHRLFLNMHHIISDGWSIGVLTRELAILYDAFNSGQPSPLPELDVQYADYAAWQREWLQGEILEEHLEYWRAQLAGAPPTVELPADRPRRSVQSYNGARQLISIPPPLIEKLRAFSRKEGVTLYLTFLTAFQMLLSRYSGQHDVVIGTAVANRRHAEIEGLIGFFVNMLAMRIDLGGGISIRDAVRRTRETALEAYAHQDVPFEMLVERLRPEREMSRTPLFQVTFVLQNMPVTELRLNRLQLSQMEVETGQTQFDLMLILYEAREEGVNGYFSYNTDLFDARTIERLAEGFKNFLNGIVSDAHAIVSKLPLLSEAERDQLLFAWNDTRTEYDRSNSCLHQMFEAQVERTPDAVALVAGDSQLTYSSLNRNANRLAHYLGHFNAGPESLIGIFLERSPALIVSLLAVQKAGCAYVPLDPEHPSGRLALMIEAARLPVILTEERLSARLPAYRGETLCLDARTDPIARQSEGNPAGGVSPDNLAYVIYTSGSTGAPKGVSVAHRGVMRLVSETNYARFAADEVFLQYAPISFDASTFEIWGALLHGARLILAPPGRQSLERLGETIRRHEVTTLWLTAGLFHLMVDERMEDLQGVRQLLAGGDVLSVSHVRKALSELRGRRIINGYGPTENTTFTCCQELRAGEEPAGSVPIGRPISNTRVYILDDHLEPVPIGVIGELYIGGEGLARGYTYRPDLTADRFLPDPFAAGGGELLYRSGDFVRYLPDGRIEFLGRRDEQVKIRGFRIELGEIEAALDRHASVRESVVVTQQDAGGDKRLVAFVVAVDGERVRTEALRDYLRGYLPEYMAPSAVVELEALPLTPSGKIDRRKLPAVELSKATAGAEDCKPRTPVEEMLAGIWQEVLKQEQIPVEENFFELGGHSLLATQVTSRIRAVFGVEVELRKLFEKPTVRGLAEEIEKAIGEGGRLEAPPIRRTPREGRAALSYAQQRLWFLARLEPNSGFYNMPGGVRLRGRLDETALRRSINEVVRRHEALRTRFEVDGVGPVQVIEEAATVDLQRLDLSRMEQSRREKELERIGKREAAEPFDLEQCPLLRTKLIRMEEQEHVLLITMHHIVGDGWSTGVLIKEISELYEAYSKGGESPLEELEVQYADYAEWQRGWLQGEALERLLGYWKQQLAEASPVLELYTDHPRPQKSSHRGEYQIFMLSADLSASLDALSRREGVTPFMTFLAAFKVLLSRYSKQRDIIVGTAIAGRNRSETERLIGCFINMLVLRTDLSDDPRFCELLSRIRTMTLGAYERQDLPFDLLVDVLQPKRDLSHAPLFQVVFGMQNTEKTSFGLSDLQLSPLQINYETVRYDLSAWISEESEGMAIRWTYSTELFEPETIRRMNAHYMRLLRTIIARPDARLSDLDMLTEEEKARSEREEAERKMSRNKRLRAVKRRTIRAGRQQGSGEESS